MRSLPGGVELGNLVEETSVDSVFGFRGRGRSLYRAGDGA